MSGGTYRTRSSDNVLAEVDEMKERFNTPFYFIADDTFTVFHDRTRKICAGLKKMGLRWLCESRANFVNRDLLSMMADSGCYAIQFGIESGSQTVLNSIRKGITIDQVRNAAKWARELNLFTVCSFMVPHPEDTLETIAETKRVMLELKSQGVFIFVSPTTPFPGTHLWDNATELGVRMVSDNLEDYDLATPIMETRHLSINQVSSAYEDLVSICPEIPDVQPS